MKGIKKVTTIYTVVVTNGTGGEKVDSVFEQNFKPNETKILVDSIKLLEKNWKEDCKTAIANKEKAPKKPSYMFDISVTERKEIRIISLEDFMLYSKIVDENTTEN